MTSSGTLQECDLRSLIAVVEDGRRDDPGEAMPWAVLDGLTHLIGCDCVSFDELDPNNRIFVTQQNIDDGERSIFVNGQDTPDNDNPFWTYYQHCMPCRYPQLAGDLISIVKLSDFYTTAELKNVPAWADYFVEEATHYMYLSLPTLPGRTRRVSLCRGPGRDFTERDRLILQILRPHMYEVYLDAERRRRKIPHLSRREHEVLQLAAAGHSNADIARSLFITVATVRKHLEHIFDRTGVRTRAAAAALALPLAPWPTQSHTPSHNRHARPVTTTVTQRMDATAKD